MTLLRSPGCAPTIWLAARCRHPPAPPSSSSPERSTWARLRQVHFLPVLLRIRNFCFRSASGRIRPAVSKFRIRFWIKIRIRIRKVYVGSGFGSNQKVSDPYGSGSATLLPITGDPDPAVMLDVNHFMRNKTYPFSPQSHFLFLIPPSAASSFLILTSVAFFVLD